MLFLCSFFIIIFALGGSMSAGSYTASEMSKEDIEEDSDYDNYVPEGNSEIGNAIVLSAMKKLGCHYVWGAEGPDTFDCSGLVWWACHENNVNFTRTTASELSKMGIEVSKEELQPGDIITFKTDPSYVSHVGIYIGDGKMIHAPNQNTVVRIDVIFSSKYWNAVTYNYRRLY